MRDKYGPERRKISKALRRADEMPPSRPERPGARPPPPAAPGTRARGGQSRGPGRVFVCASCRLRSATPAPRRPGPIMKGKRSSKKVEPVRVMDNLNGLSPLTNRCRS